jgi:uncharacterized damage-inducible protein DinB
MAHKSSARKSSHTDRCDETSGLTIARRFGPAIISNTDKKNWVTIRTLMPMKSRRIASYLIAGLAFLCASSGLHAQGSPDIKALVVKHLTVSRDFTLKVADQMPASDYGFKLTPPQMSFAEQMVHLSQAFEEFLAPLSEEKLDLGKPASMNKPDVLAFVRKSFDAAIARVTKLTPAQISKSYKGEEGPVTGADMLMELLDHTTHHRASAEMYLRAKGITPAEYQF